ncbi:MAG: GNAT family N-acetyltransferase [Ruminococcaceae bacterium]|nr:GNAT family N-acetyltransferase [Oscillospiraceae bacterium]
MIIEAPRRTDIPDLCALWKRVFGDTDAFLDTFFATAFSPDRALLARIDGEVVGMLYWFNCEYNKQKIAYLYAVATHEAYRGRGICHALMDATHRLLRERKYVGVILVPAEAHLFDFYKKQGYRICTHISILHTNAADESVALQSVDAKTYATLRRALLPRGGVIQEDENLTFLQEEATFYSGEGFLLSAKKEQDTLVGIELLGAVSLAARITRALGCTEGRFRIPGDERPFAMYLSLTPTPLPPPSYFGLAFD